MTVALVVLVGGVVTLVLPARYRLPVWVAVLTAIALPWGDFQNHPHWDAVEWWFIDPPLKAAANVLANGLLYAPLGWLTARRRPGSGALVRAAAWGLLLSLALETTQAWSHTRFPSLIDLMANTLGALVGALAVPGSNAPSPAASARR